MNLLIGSHVSFKSEQQLLASCKEAYSYGANVFMIYTGAPQNTTRSIIKEDLTKQAYNFMDEHNMKKEYIIVHAPYIVNLANPKNLDFSISFLKQEVQRVESLGLKYLILHPGSALTLSKEEAISNISFGLNEILKTSKNVMICLETMAGKGSEIGSNFDEIQSLIEKIEEKNKIGVCLDTCHLHDAGYDVSQFDQMLEEFDQKIGLSYLKCIHINDSKNLRNAHKDRHANLGYGEIGFENLLKIIYHDKLKNIPKILETPYIVDESKNAYPPYKFEIRNILNKKIEKDLSQEVIEYYKNK